MARGAYGALISILARPHGSLCCRSVCRGRDAGLQRSTGIIRTRLECKPSLSVACGAGVRAQTPRRHRAAGNIPTARSGPPLPPAIFIGRRWPNGPWRTAEEVEFAVLEWVDWFNQRRLLSSIGDVPPAEFEAMYYAAKTGPAKAAGLN